MLRRYAFGGLTPPAAAAFIATPTDYEVSGGWWLDGWIRMSIAGAWRGLGEGLMAGECVDSGEQGFEG
jgi:hypothetical protein